MDPEGDALGCEAWGSRPQQHLLQAEEQATTATATTPQQTERATAATTSQRAERTTALNEYFCQFGKILFCDISCIRNLSLVSKKPLKEKFKNHLTNKDGNQCLDSHYKDG